jgi:hypothetical protein
MRIRRSLPIVFGVLLVAGAVAFVVVLRKHAPPEAARLLPGADGFAYIDLKWMRRANLLGELPPVPHDPAYEQFIQATGIQAERDLEEAAVAVHYPSNSPGPDQNSEMRFSEVMVGHFQAEPLTAYLRKLSNSVEAYRSSDIYSIPLENRTLRVALLGVDTVAASNVADPQVIKGIIDRSRKMASPFGGPALLRQYYKEVPLASLGWGILRIDPTLDKASATPLSPSFLFSKSAVIVASLRYLGSIHLRAEAFTGSDDEAAHLTEKLGTFLDVFRTANISVSPSGTDPDVKALFDSIKVEQKKDRVEVTAMAPVGFLRKMLSEAPTATPLEAPKMPTSAPAVPPAKGKKRH